MTNEFQSIHVLAFPCTLLFAETGGCDCWFPASKACDSIREKAIAMPSRRNGYPSEVIEGKGTERTYGSRLESCNGSGPSGAN
jgi:hypothetical protein